MVARANERYRSITAGVIWQMLGRQRGWIVALFALAGPAFTAALGVAVVVRDAVDLAIVEQTEPLSKYIGLLILLAFMGLFFGIPFRQVVARLGFHLEYQLRLWVYQRLQAMHPAVLDALASGQAATRAMTDLTMLELATLLIPSLAVGVVLLLALAVVMLVQDPLLGCIALLSMPMNLYLIIRIRRPLFGMAWNILANRAEVTTAIDEAVRGARVVKAFAREDDERARVATTASDVYAHTMNRVRLTAKYDFILRALPICIDATLLILGGRRVIDGRFSIGQLLIFLVFTGVFTGLARQFGELVSVWQLARSGARRIFQLIEMAPAAPPPPPPPGPGEPLLVTGAGLSVELQPGELVLLEGALPPGTGGPGVLVLEPQPFLFSGTIAENLRLADPTASDERLRELIAVAAAEDVVETLGGLDGEVGDRGLTLSGGQRQRLAIARALVKPPPILVLDDALAAVNPALELDILRRVRAFAPTIAILTVSTRPTVAAAADRTVVSPLREKVDGVNPGAALLASLAGAKPEDLLPPEVKEAVATVDEPTDRPAVDEATATACDEPPSVHNILQPFGRGAIVASALLVLVTIIELGPPALVQLGVDDVREGTTSTLDKVAIGVALCGVAIGLLTWAFKIVSGQVTEGIMYLLRRRTFQRLTRLGVDYYDRELPGKVAARVVHDLDRISAFVETGVYRAAAAILVVLLTVVAMLLWSVQVALVLILTIPILVVLTVIEVPIANWAYDRARAKLGVVIARLQEDLAGRYVISGLDARSVARERFAQAARELRAERRLSTLVSNVYAELVQFFVALATAGVLGLAGTKVIAGDLSVGSAITLQLYLATALAPIAALSAVLQSYLAARASFRTLGEPFVAPIYPVPPPADVSAPESCPPLQGAISFQGVGFTYPGTQVGSSRVDLQACKLEYSIVSPK